MEKSFKAVLAGCFTAFLIGCGGGGGGSTVLVATSDAQVSANATVVGAVAGTPFTFPSGVPALGTTGTTTLAFSGTAASPGFDVSSGGNTAGGTVGFGSCVFVVSRSTFPAGHPMALGQTVTINPCAVSMAVSNATANGQPVPRSIALLLGAAASSGSSATVAVTPSGQLVLNGANVVTIGLTPVSG